MAEVHVLRYSTNPQIKSFNKTELPATFWAPDKDGREREYNFWDAFKKPGNFIIDEGGTMKLDTNREIDKHNVECLEAILRRREGVPPGSEFRVIDLEKEANQDVATRSNRIKALIEIDKRKGDAGFIGSMARRIGIAGIGSLSPNEVLNLVQKRAEDAPNEVLDILDNVYQAQLFELDKAKESGIITLRNGFYYYGQINIGINEGSVINYFEKHPDVYADITMRNGAIYGGAMANAQSEAIRRILGGDTGEKPAQSNASILGDIPYEGGSMPSNILADEFTADNQTVQLLAKARELGVVREDESDEYSRHLVFNNVRLIVPDGPMGFVKQGQAFLMNKANKGVRSAIETATKQVERQQPATA